jgi:predicted phosphodiesterase
MNSPPTSNPNLVKTRFLIISDTHGMDFTSENRPTHKVDVVIHCGDLTDGSKLSEFRNSLQLLKDLDAPLKLVIAGNHDFTMDIPAFEKHVSEAPQPLEPELVVKEYGAHGEAQKLFAQEAGIVFLDEGTHRFILANGASLTVYASPYTPALGAWGFQYHPDKDHEFAIEEGTDVAVTHGPPKGVMDFTYGRERAGCPYLFGAVAKAKPKMHCFGHIHEGWGAKLVTWRPQLQETPSHFTDIDNDRSTLVEKLANLKPSKFDMPEDLERKEKKLKQYVDERCCKSSHCNGDPQAIEQGAQTLFVNASIMDADQMLVQKPWLVDIELTRSI